MKAKSVEPRGNPKKYCLMNEDDLPNPFGSELFNDGVNKTNPFLTVTSSPAVIPAESLGPPTLEKEPSYNILYKKARKTM